MTEQEALAIPLSEIELAALSDACRQGLTIKGMLMFRRLAYERHMLRAEVARLRGLLDAFTSKATPDA